VQLLEDPALTGVEIGTAQWFALQRSIIANRPLVKASYDRWYQAMLGDVATVPAERSGRILEIGSGSGYVKTIDADVVTSDIVDGHADLVVDAQQLPFDAASLRGILLTHVFHHIPDVSRFLDEAMRTLVPGGVIAMIDVAHTPLARLLFGNFHPEAYDMHAERWQLDPSGPCGGANQALSWIVFHRDRAAFERRYPGLRIECVERLPWLGYLISGGATRRDLVPKPLVPAIEALDAATRALDPLCALHWHIRIRKTAS
jgi:SAM-dependent methyltransferase